MEIGSVVLFFLVGAVFLILGFLDVHRGDTGLAALMFTVAGLDLIIAVAAWLRARKGPGAPAETPEQAPKKGQAPVKKARKKKRKK